MFFLLLHCDNCGCDVTWIKFREHLFFFPLIFPSQSYVFLLSFHFSGVTLHVVIILAVELNLVRVRIRGCCSFISFGEWTRARAMGLRWDLI